MKKLKLISLLLSIFTLSSCVFVKPNDNEKEKVFTNFSYVDNKSENYYIGDKFESFIDNGGLSIYKNYDDGSQEILNYYNSSNSKNNYTVTINNSYSPDEGFLTAQQYEIKVMIPGASYIIYSVQVKSVNFGVESISLDVTDKTIYCDEQFQIHETILPKNATNKGVVWSSSNSDVASVNNGLVTGKNTGDATITATTSDGNFQATCNVHVNKRVPQGQEYYKITFKKNDSDSGTNLNTSTIFNEITSGEENISSFSDVDNIFPGEKGLKIGSKSKSGVLGIILDESIQSLNIVSLTLNVERYSSDTGNVKLSADNTGLFNFQPSERSKTYTFTEPKQVQKIKISTSTKRAYLTSIELMCEKSVPIDPTKISIQSSLSMNVGDSSNLRVSFTPSNANQNKEILWSSSDTSIASVNNGVVTALKKGTATITAKLSFNNSIQASCAVNVSNISVTSITLDKSVLYLTLGAEKQLTATVLPANATDKTVTWTSSNTSVATVANGNITPISKGQTIVRVTTTDGNKVASCTVNVTDQDTFDYDWLIMVYMCGSTLEWDQGLHNDYPSYDEYYQYAASRDIEEMLDANIPDSVKVIIQTGGSKKWGLSSSKIDGQDKISNTVLQRWEVGQDKLIYRGNGNGNQMSTKDSLLSFMNWSLENYNAENVGVIFWNHGGGIGGCCNDSNNSNNALKTSDIASASRTALSTFNRDKFEFIGYDACLMNVADIASVNSQFYHYMVASQETEPGAGWDYTAWLNKFQISHVPTTTVLSTICDSYLVDNCDNEDCGDYYYGYKYLCGSTLSVLNLDLMPTFIDTLDNYLNSFTCASNQIFSTIAEAMKKSLEFGYYEVEKAYGGGYSYQGYNYGVVDAISLFNNLKDVNTMTDSIVSQVKNIVVYNKYCLNTYTSEKPCGLSMFVSTYHRISGSGYGYVDPYKSDYSGSDNSLLTSWQTLMLIYGDW